MYRTGLGLYNVCELSEESDGTGTIDLKEAPQRLHELIPMVEIGTEAALTDNDTPVARRVAVAPLDCVAPREN